MVLGSPQHPGGVRSRGRTAGPGRGADSGGEDPPHRVSTQVNGVRDAARERLEFRGYHNLETLMSDPTRGGKGSHHRAEGGGGNLPPAGAGRREKSATRYARTLRPARGCSGNTTILKLWCYSPDLHVSCMYAKNSVGLFRGYHNVKIVVFRAVAWISAHTMAAAAVAMVAMCSTSYSTVPRFQVPPLDGASLGSGSGGDGGDVLY